MLKENSNAHRRVVITGIGVVSALGLNAEEFWNNVIDGEDGISNLSDTMSENAYSKRYGLLDKDKINEQVQRNLSQEEQMKYGYCTKIALLAAKQAVMDARVEVASKVNDRISVVMGTALGEQADIEHKLEESEDTKIVRSIDIASAIARMIYAGGEVHLNTNACSSSNLSITYGMDLIKKNRADCVLVGGADVFSEVVYSGFLRLKLLSDKDVKPFDVNRNGTILSEGAAVLVLEDYETAKKRNANIYAEIVSAGLSNDAFSIAAPAPDGKGVKKALRDAIANAGIELEDVDYISLHGTGTLANDENELKAIQSVFGYHSRNIYGSSIKGALGHTLGAASAFETIVCAYILKEGKIPLTLHTEHVIKECPINLVINKSIKKEVNVVLNNAFGFGGSNCIIVMKRCEEE